MTQTDIQTQTNKTDSARKVRDSEVDEAAFQIVAAVIEARCKNRHYRSSDKTSDWAPQIGGLKLATIIKEVHRMADYLQQTFGREHFAYFADYDVIINRLMKKFE